MNEVNYLWNWMSSCKPTRITLNEVIIAGVICHFFEDSTYLPPIFKWVKYRLLATIIGFSTDTSKKLYKIWVKRRKDGKNMFSAMYTKQELLSILDEYYGRIH